MPSISARIRDRITGEPDPVGVQARHVERSAIASLDDEPAVPSGRLLDVAEQAISVARRVSLDAVSSRIKTGPQYPDVWPGEHYRLLAALVQVTGAKRVVEIGTFTGLGTLALLANLPEDGQLVTFDILAWDEIPGTVLNGADLADPRLTQVVADITKPEGFAAHRETLRDADLIFADAAKDGTQERVFLQRFDEVGFTHAPIVVFDDIRVMNMLQIWRDIRRPKLDITSFGHWSGTGLVDYS
jgi:predicted O-methyltransferase YrrM